MTRIEPLYGADAYRREAPARVVDHVDGTGLILDLPLFYPTGGGQPGDAGWLDWPGARLAIHNTQKTEDGHICVAADPAEPWPPIGTEVVQNLDWTMRYGHMRVHTLLHLLSVVIPLPVTGGSIAAAKGRLDFAMPDAPDDKPALEAQLQALIDRDLPVTETWIDEADLDANPGLVKTLRVQPPRGAGRIRLVRIGNESDTIDLQPCGGTHVARTSEIGPIRLGKIEKKGRINRRVYVHLANA